MLRRWLKLWRLARIRLRSEAHYQAFQHYQGQWVIEGLIYHGCELSDHWILDLGCGYGGYSLALKEAGARVVALDLFLSASFLKEGVMWLRGDALCLPFLSGSFDGVFCASLIEHVPDPLKLLHEIRRVLRKRGWAYVSFPPFYSPRGGHQFSPFHYFGERIALALIRRRRWWGESSWVPKRFPVSPSSFAHAFGDYGLFPLTIRRARELINEVGFQIIHQGVRFMPLNFSRLPLLGEILTWHVEFILRS
jgi:SAM-dependent methyltransferase